MMDDTYYEIKFDERFTSDEFLLWAEKEAHKIDAWNSRDASGALPEEASGRMEGIYTSVIAYAKINGLHDHDDENAYTEVATFVFNVNGVRLDA